MSVWAWLAVVVAIVAGVITGIAMSDCGLDKNGRDAFWVSQCAQRRPLIECERDYDKLWPRP